MRTVVALSIAATLAGAPAAAGPGFVLYDVTAGPPLPPSNGVPEFHGQSPVPVTAGGRFDSSHGGALCPDPGTTDYLCGRYYASADVVGGRLLILRTEAQVHAKHDVSRLVYSVFGDAKVEIYGMNVSASAPVGFAYFNLGLSGSATSSATDAGVNAQAFGTVRVNGNLVICSPGVCPIKLSAAEFNPALNTFELRADASITSAGTFTTPVDADAVANFADTMQLLSIELHDANDQPIPGAEVYLTDQNDVRTFTFPNTIATTTTVIAGSTTTTTLAGGCPEVASYSSIDCRLGELSTLVQGGAGKLAAKLKARLEGARGAVGHAAQPGTPSRRVAKSLKKALRSLAKYGKVLESKRAKKTIDDPVRTSLRAHGTAIEVDVQTLLDALS